MQDLFSYRTAPGVVDLRKQERLAAEMIGDMRREYL
jgi:capsule polysaccharide export protein KpsE/RkpR